LRGLNYGYFEPKLQSMVARGMEAYLCQNKILFKDYFDYVKRISREVKQASIQAFEKLGLPVPFLRNPSADKEAIAREIAQDKKVESGLVCALSTVEPGITFEHLGTHMVRRMKPCQAIYHYPIDPQLGWLATVLFGSKTTRRRRSD
jgi:hypothetical protein